MHSHFLLSIRHQMRRVRQFLRNWPGSTIHMPNLYHLPDRSAQGRPLPCLQGQVQTRTSVTLVSAPRAPLSAALQCGLWFPRGLMSPAPHLQWTCTKHRPLRGLWPSFQFAPHGNCKAASLGPWTELSALASPQPGPLRGQSCSLLCWSLRCVALQAQVLMV